MNLMEIKLTLLRSNPLVMRQFYVRPEISFQDLADAISIMMRWDEENNDVIEIDFIENNGRCPYSDQESSYENHKTLNVYEDKYSLTDQESSYENRKTLNIEEEKYSLTDQVRSRDESSFFAIPQIGGEFIFKIDIVRRDVEAARPEMTRQCGGCLPPECDSIEFFNQLQAFWNGEYISGGYSYRLLHFPRRDYDLSSFEANRRLTFLWGSKADQKKLKRISTILDSDFDFGIAESLQKMNMNFLKAEANRIGIPTRGQKRKFDLIDLILHQLGSPVFFEWVMMTVGVSRFETLMSLFNPPEEWRAEERIDHQVYLLQELNYLELHRSVHLRDLQVWVSDLFLNSLARWMESQDEFFVPELFVRSVLFGAVTIYGVLHEETFLTLCREVRWQDAMKRRNSALCESEEEVSDTEAELIAERVWKKVTGALENGIFPYKMLGKNAIFNSDYMDEPTALKIFKMQKDHPENRFHPTFEMLDEFETFRVPIRPADRFQIDCSEMGSYSSHIHYLRSIDRIFSLVGIGWQSTHRTFSDFVVREIRSCGFSDRAVKQIHERIKAAEKKTRKAFLFGWTEEELQQKKTADRAAGKE